MSNKPEWEKSKSSGAVFFTKGEGYAYAFPTKEGYEACVPVRKVFKSLDEARDWALKVIASSK